MNSITGSYQTNLQETDMYLEKEPYSKVSLPKTLDWSTQIHRQGKLVQVAGGMKARKSIIETKPGNFYPGTITKPGNSALVQRFQFLSPLMVVSGS